MALIGRYENHEDGHDKFWELTQTKTGTYLATWGRCGTQGQGPKEYTLEEAEKVVKAKLKKGYELVA